MFIAPRASRELLQEAQVGAHQVADVVDAVALHDDPREAHAEGEAGVALGVDAAVLQHHRVDHAAAAGLDPAALLADLAALAAADQAAHVELEAGLDEREVAGPQAHLDVAPEEVPQHRAHAAHEVADGDAFVDDAPLELVEGVLVARVD